MKSLHIASDMIVSLHTVIVITTDVSLNNNVTPQMCTCWVLRTVSY